VSGHSIGLPFDFKILIPIFRLTESLC